MGMASGLAKGFGDQEGKIMKPDLVALQAEYEKTLSRAAELKVQLDRAAGIASGKVVPHDSVIEDAAHEAGMGFRRQLQERHMRELSASHVGTAKCPKWGERCVVDAAARKVTSGDGPVQLAEAKAYCPTCRRAFFPSA